MNDADEPGLRARQEADAELELVARHLVAGEA